MDGMESFTMLELVNDKFNAHRNPYGQALKQKQQQIVSQIPLGVTDEHHLEFCFRDSGAYNSLLLSLALAGFIHLLCVLRTPLWRLLCGCWGRTGFVEKQKKG
jgi:hypothetical protein